VLAALGEKQFSSIHLAFALSPPTLAIECGRVEGRGGSGGNTSSYTDAVVVISNHHSGEHGDGGFEFNSEGNGFGLLIPISLRY